MADNCFDRTIYNVRERPMSPDNNQLESQIDRTIRETLRAQALPHAAAANAAGASGFQPISGFYGDGFFVTPGGGLSVNLTPGLGMIFDAGTTAVAIDSISGLNDLSPYYPVYLSAVQNIVLAAAPSAGNERYDLIEVTLDRRRENLLNRDVLNPGTGTFDPTLISKTLAYRLDGRNGSVVAPSNSTTGIGYKQGVTAAIGTASVPATSPGYTRVAVIYVANGVATIVANLIRDSRRLLLRDGHETLGFQVSIIPGDPADTVTLISHPAIHAGIRLAARSTGILGGPLKVYIFAGEVLTDSAVQKMSAYPLADSYATAVNNLLGRIAGVSAATIDAGEQSALSGIIDVAIGQTYLTFTVTKDLIHFSDGTPAAWTWNLVCPISTY